MSPIERSAGGGGAAAGGLVKIFDTTLGVAAATIDTGAAGVPSGHAALFIWVLMRSDKAANNDLCNMTFNGDSAAHYDSVFINADSGTFNGARSLAAPAVQFGIPAANATAGYPAVWRMSIPGYDQTTFFKTGEVMGGWVSQLVAGLQWQTDQEIQTWRNTAAITQITSTCAGGNFIAGSRMQIYGIQ